MADPKAARADPEADHHVQAVVVPDEKTMTRTSLAAVGRVAKAVQGVAARGPAQVVPVARAAAVAVEVAVEVAVVAQAVALARAVREARAALAVLAVPVA